MIGRTYKYMDLDPMYPFGYGLSYTTFKYSNVNASSKSISKNSTITLSVDVTNDGDVDSDEVVQLYITDVEASFRVPNSQLKAFKRVSIKSGETKKIEFKLTSEMFEVVNELGEKVLEPGEFKVYVGGSSPMARSKELGIDIEEITLKI